METVQMCKHCRRTADVNFTGIHICPDQTLSSGSTQSKCLVVSKLGCPDHQIDVNRFMSNEAVVLTFKDCKLCLSDLIQKILPERDWIYDINPDLYDWFTEQLSKYQWDDDDRGQWKCVGPLPEGEECLYWPGQYIMGISNRKEFGYAEQQVVAYLNTLDDTDIMHNFYEWMETLVFKSPDFIKAVCHAYGADIQPHYNLAGMFCIACLNDCLDTARWLVSEYREGFKFYDYKYQDQYEHINDLGFRIFQKEKYGECLTIRSASDLVDIIMKHNGFNEILKLLKEYYPDAFPRFVTPVPCNNVLMVYYLRRNKRPYDLKSAVIKDVNLVSMCTGIPMVPATTKWRGIGITTGATPAGLPADLPEDMIVDLVIPWHGTELIVYYGYRKKDSNTYIVVANQKSVIYVFREDYCSLQTGDAGTECSIASTADGTNYMLIDNYGDVESQVLVVTTSGGSEINISQLNHL